MPDHRPSGVRSAHLRTSILLLIALVAAACGGGDSGGASADRGGSGGGAQGSNESLVIAIGDEPSTLDPQAAEDGNTRAVTDNIYETLLRRNSETAELEPLLATELPTQVDDTTWEFQLREGVTFTNGEPFNAEAAAFSVNRIVDPEYNSAQGDFQSGVVGGEAVGEYTLRIMTEEFDPVLPARMYRLQMVPPVAAMEEGFPENPVGTGPYKFVAWQRGQNVELEVNEDYWGEVPPIKKATLRFVSQSSSRLAGLQTGEIHLATLIPPEQAQDAPEVLSRDGLEFPVYRLKNYEGVLQDPKIRQAMNYAVDKQAIADDLFSGYASIAQCQPLTEAHVGFNPDLEPYPYDPEKAEQLLQEAGYNGEPVELLGATGRWLKDNEMHEVVAGYLSAVGMTIEPDIRPFSSYITEFARPVGDPQPPMGFVSASNEMFDATLIESYYSSEGSLSSYVNEDVDAALAAARGEADVDAREGAFHEALQTACEDDPVFIFTVNLQDIYGTVENFDWKPRADASLYIPEMSFS